MTEIVAKLATKTYDRATREKFNKIINKIRINCRFV